MPRKHQSTQKHREKTGREPKKTPEHSKTPGKNQESTEKHPVFHTLRVGMWKTSLPIRVFMKCI